MTQKTESKESYVPLIGLVGYVLSCIALYQVSPSTDSTWVPIVGTAIIAIIIPSLWAVAYNFFAMIPILGNLWVYLGLISMYVFPLLVWFS